MESIEKVLDSLDGKSIEDEAEKAAGQLMEHGAPPAVVKAVSDEVRKGLAKKMRNLPPDMVFEVALGLEDEEDIAERFGFTADEYSVIRTLKPFMVQVKKVRSDLEKSGDMFRNKAKIMAEQVLDAGFRKAIDEATPLKETTEFLKVAANLADLNPKTVAALPGAGFSVNIVLPEITAESVRATEKAKKEAMATITGEASVVDAVEVEVPDGEAGQDA